MFCYSYQEEYIDLPCIGNPHAVYPKRHDDPYITERIDDDFYYTGDGFYDPNTRTVRNHIEAKWTKVDAEKCAWIEQNCGRRKFEHTTPRTVQSEVGQYD